MESTPPNTKGTIPKKKRNRVKKKYQPTNRYIYIYPCSRLRETRADPRTTIEGIADRGWTEGRKGTKQSRDKLEAARWKSSSLRADTKRWGREREKERRRKEKENGGANRFLAAFPAAASAVAAWVRSAVHGCQGGKRGGGGRRRGGGGQERGRWLARLILSAAEIVQHPSLSLSSPFSTFHPSSSPVFFLCSHFHLSSVPPRLSLSLSLVFHPVSRLPLALSRRPSHRPLPFSYQPQRGGEREEGWPKKERVGGGVVDGTWNAWLATLLDAPDESVRPGVDDGGARATFTRLRKGMGAGGGGRVMRRKDGAQRDIARRIRPGKRQPREKKAQFSRASPTLSSANGGLTPGLASRRRKNRVVRCCGFSSFFFFLLFSSLISSFFFSICDF